MHDFKSVLAEGMGHYLMHSSKKENNPTKSTVKTIIGCACRGAVFGPVGALIGGLVGAGIEVLASDHELREKLGDKLGL